MTPGVEVRVVEVRTGEWEQAWLVPEMVQAELVVRPGGGGEVRVVGGINGKSLTTLLKVLLERGSFDTYFGSGVPLRLRLHGSEVEAGVRPRGAPELVSARIGVEEWADRLRRALEEFEAGVERMGGSGDESAVREDVEALWALWEEWKRKNA
ncbi:MAG: hypothetical protein HY558_07480 [Euryarchaeota archaeon]|nr:hypothetical protein [Euryarchaeota archaeon]